MTTTDKELIKELTKELKTNKKSLLSRVNCMKVQIKLLETTVKALQVNDELCKARACS